MFADRRAKLVTWARARRVATGRSARSVSRWAAHWRAELLLVAAVLGGWASLTIGLCALLPDHAVRATWAISIGVLLLSVCGWGFLGELAFRGIYVATRKRGDG